MSINHSQSTVIQPTAIHATASCVELQATAAGFREAIEANIRVVDRLGKLSAFERDRAVSWQQLAVVLESLGKFEEADQAYRHATSIFDVLSVNDPISRSMRASAYYNQAAFLLRRHHVQGAVDSFGVSIDQLDILIADSKPSQVDLRLLADACDQLGTIYLRQGELAKATRPLERAKSIWLNWPAAANGGVHVEMGLQQASCKCLLCHSRCPDAEQTAIAFCESHATDPLVSYNMACMLALCLQQYQRGKTKVPEDTVRLQSHIMRMLKRALDASPGLLPQVECDPDFTSLRDYPPFKALNTQARDPLRDDDHHRN